MPLKVNVGLSRKVGEANYGSRGASVHVEVELDAGLVADPPRLQEKIRLLFDLARGSVAEELHRGEESKGLGPHHNGTRANGAAGNPPTNGYGADNGNGTSCRAVPRAANQSQVKALSRSRGLDLEALLQDHFRLHQAGPWCRTARHWSTPGSPAGLWCPSCAQDDPSWEAAVGLSPSPSRGSMNARHKLNGYALKGILLAAGGIGLLSGSWVVFLLAAAVLVGLALHDGSIRPSPRKRRFR